MKAIVPMILATGCLFAGCEETPAPQAAAEIPKDLAPFGDGFPTAGNPCRRLGESPATSNYLDHTRILVGCPGNRESAVVQAVIATGGHILTEIDGVVMLSVPVPAGKKSE